MSRIDPHSYVDPEHGTIQSMALNLIADFEKKRLLGNVCLVLDRASPGILHLDTRDLDISEMVSENGPVSWSVGESDPILGSCLEIELPKGVWWLSITYTTSPHASALQWLTPSQTAGKEYPYLFSQCQAIHARSIVPVQDSPSVRFQYTASITAPKPLVAVMSAESGKFQDSPDGRSTIYTFDMPQPIPAYLLALAIGNLDFKDLGPRSRVYTEPEMLDKAAWEFADIDAMLSVAENLFGPYQWDRYDVLVMPPSFPYGGMENPRLSFLTPTLISGDRSQVHVLAHEMSHSWTGNLVTNATMNDFWLNEGVTMWGERRILEELYGKELVALQIALGRKELDDAIERFGKDSQLTQLKVDLEGIDPDETFSRIPYEKGFLFMALLEQTAGREVFDKFMREYMEQFAFKSITTEDFLEFLESRLPGLAEKVNAEEWIYKPGIPDNAPVFHSEKLVELQALAGAWNKGRRPSPDEVHTWSADELLIYLKGLPEELSFDECAWLDQNLSLAESGHAEILSTWFSKVAASGYKPAFTAMREFVGTIGRFFLIKYIYKALSENEKTHDLAQEWYDECKEGYHPITRQIIEGHLKTD